VYTHVDCSRPRPAIYDTRAAAGFPVSAADRLSDTLINGASKTGRHNLFNRACRDALAAATNHEVILGATRATDRGVHVKAWIRIVGYLISSDTSPFPHYLTLPDGIWLLSVIYQ
jgi:predicted RNase H-like nuclease